MERQPINLSLVCDVIDTEGREEALDRNQQDFEGHGRTRKHVRCLDQVGSLRHLSAVVSALSCCPVPAEIALWRTYSMGALMEPSTTGRSGQCATDAAAAHAAVRGRRQGVRQARCSGQNLMQGSLHASTPLFCIDAAGAQQSAGGQPGDSGAAPRIPEGKQPFSLLAPTCAVPCGAL